MILSIFHEKEVMEIVTYKTFLTEELRGKLLELKADTTPQFGVMTPQHMVEHLTFIIKVTTKRYGDPPKASDAKSNGFKRFIENGAKFEHRPGNAAKEDLPELKYNSLDEAIENLLGAVKRFYDHYDHSPDFKCLNPMMGELGFEELQLFHYQHCRYHFWQFNLIDNY